MIPKLFTIILVLFSISACSSTGVFTGHVIDSEGQPLTEVNVQFWQNQWIPFHLPERIAETKTDSSGNYHIIVRDNVSFIVVEDNPITFSKSVKPNRGNIEHHHEIEVPKI